MSESSHLFSQFMRTLHSLLSVRRPWPVFLDFTALDFPSSVSDATTRVAQNLTHFRANYALLLHTILFLTLITRPFPLLAYFSVHLAWLVLYFFRLEPLSVCGLEVNDWVVLAVLVLATVFVLSAAGIWLNVIVAAAVASGLVVLHAVLRSTDDLVADEFEVSPYGNLLDDDDEESSPGGGAYTQI